MNGEDRCFIVTLFLQSTFVGRVAVAIVQALAKAGLP